MDRRGPRRLQHPRRSPQGRGLPPPPETGPGCKISQGKWYSPYDNAYVDDASRLDIDRLVPLAEAWDSGAGTWSAGERPAYANDPGDDRPLLAVFAKTNRSKADQDRATWLPPFAGDRCTDVTDWPATKMRRQLAVDPAERARLEREFTSCPNAPVTVTLAR